MPKAVVKPGFTAAWLPCPLKGNSGGYSMGYDPFDDYDLGSKNQKSTLPTRFGTREALQRACATLRANGIEATIRLGTYRPDLLILDVFMPEMDGLEVCRSIQTEPALAGVKVIITTGYPGHPKLDELAGLGFGHVLTKPFDIPLLLHTVQDLLIER